MKRDAKSSRQLGKKHPSPRFNSMAVKDGRLPAAARSEDIRSPSNGERRMPRAAASSGKSTLRMAVKDGRLLEGPLGRDPFARFETPIEQGSKASQKAQKRFATPKEHGTAGQIVPSKGSWSWRRQLLNCLPVKENRPLLMLRCLGRLPLQWQRQGSADNHSHFF